MQTPCMGKRKNGHIREQEKLGSQKWPNGPKCSRKKKSD